MRVLLWLLAASAHATAGWLLGQELEGQEALLQPRKTKTSTYDGVDGWTPRPTEPPFVADGANALELARRRDEWIRVKRLASNTWENDRTCGWFAGPSSSPFVCSPASTCSTNSDSAVACLASGATQPFYTDCFDFQAAQQGLCSSMGSKTGCCFTSSYGACITYLWPGRSPRFMYRCYTAPMILTMLDEPQFVLDAATRTTSSTSSSSTTSTSASAQTTSSAPPPATNDSSNNTGAIVGGVVGGIAGAAIIAGAIAFLVIRMRRCSGAHGQAYSAIAPGDTSYPGAGGMMPPAGYPPQPMSPPMTQGGYSGNNTLRPETAYLSNTTTPPPHLNNTTPPAGGVYDLRQSYYDPGKVAGHTPPPPGQYPAHPGAPPPQGPYAVPGQQHPASELDHTTVASGQQGNPAEMPVNSPVGR